ncbi:MAG: Holliday junction resolvase RuvX [Brachymonas denitrificans]|jgi:putative Holliday junction resolvase|uniref:Holliday junction resolvase RuvX n=1 Tax=Brachymonas denitrificans TaxID=28220 RepID=UPI001BCA8601|nr:Holliday junction resolvase RuvX [Brachymonas denitrificans]
MAQPLIHGVTVDDLFQVPGQPPLVDPQPFQSFLALDYGKKRTGVATGNRMLGRATPGKSIAATGDARFAAVAALIAEWQPQALVIGIPYHPDGAAHENTRRATNFGRQLSQRFKLPVYTVDERYSTTEALASGAADADATAACIILEQFFNTLP